MSTFPENANHNPAHQIDIGKETQALISSQVHPNLYGSSSPTTPRGGSSKTGSGEHNPSCLRRTWINIHSFFHQISANTIRLMLFLATIAAALAVIKVVWFGATKFTFSGFGGKNNQIQGELVREPTHPHIIWITADDLGYGDISYGTSEFPTTHLSYHASQGVRLLHHYVHPSDSATRSAFLTGRYPFRSGLQRTQNSIRPGSTAHMDTDDHTLAEVLKMAGYQTHLFGKWNLGYASEDYLPLSRGFDTHFGFYQDEIDYFTRESCVSRDTISKMNAMTDLKDNEKSNDKQKRNGGNNNDHDLKPVKIHHDERRRLRLRRLIDDADARIMPQRVPPGTPPLSATSRLKPFADKLSEPAINPPSPVQDKSQPQSPPVPPTPPQTQSKTGSASQSQFPPNNPPLEAEVDAEGTGDVCGYDWWRNGRRSDSNKYKYTTLNILDEVHSRLKSYVRSESNERLFLQINLQNPRSFKASSSNPDNEGIKKGLSSNQENRAYRMEDFNAELSVASAFKHIGSGRGTGSIKKIARPVAEFSQPRSLFSVPRRPLNKVDIVSPSSNKKESLPSMKDKQSEPSSASIKPEAGMATYIDSRCMYVQEPARQEYCMLVQELDDSFGFLILLLKDYGIWEDSLVIFTSDNGASISDVCGNDMNGNHNVIAGSNYPYRGSKRNLFEGGVNTPAFITGPQVPANARGSINTDLFHASDWMSTLMHYTLGSIPESNEKRHFMNNLDGFDLWETLMYGKKNPRRSVPINIDIDGDIPTEITDRVDTLLKKPRISSDILYVQPIDPESPSSHKIHDMNTELKMKFGEKLGSNQALKNGAFKEKLEQIQEIEGEQDRSSRDSLISMMASSSNNLERAKSYYDENDLYRDIAIRNERYKLIKNHQIFINGHVCDTKMTGYDFNDQNDLVSFEKYFNNLMLFDMHNDPFEKFDLLNGQGRRSENYEKYRDVIEELMGLVDEYVNDKVKGGYAKKQENHFYEDRASPRLFQGNAWESWL